jgi:chromosome partitioning protein
MKGGVGKTTLCVNLAFELFRKGRRILLVDNDPQFNATSALLKPQRYIDDCLKNTSQGTIYNVYEKPPRIMGAKKAKSVKRQFAMPIWRLGTKPNIVLELIPSRIELYETLKNPSEKEYLLERFLVDHGSNYDYVFIDCPPTPSVLTRAAFAASDFVVIPVTPDYFATLGLPQFLGTLEEFKDNVALDSHKITPLGVVFTKVPRVETPDTRNAIQRVAEALKDLSYPVPIFNAKMTQCKVYEKSLWQSVPVQRVAGRGTRGKSIAGADLSAIALELLAKIAAAGGAAT